MAARVMRPGTIEGQEADNTPIQEDDGSMDATGDRMAGLVAESTPVNARE
jgi:hypothetical protein